MKNLRIGMKMLLGFSSIIVMAIALGLLAIVKMQGVAQISTDLKDEVSPQVTLAVSIERDVRKAMFESRGYLYTSDETFYKSCLDDLKRAQGNLDAMLQLADKHLGEAGTDATTHPFIEMKRKATDLAQDMNGYAKAAEQLYARQGEIDKTRAAMDEAAGNYVSAINQYMNSENEKMKQEIAAVVGGAKGEAGAEKGKPAQLNVVAASGTLTADKLLDRLAKINFANELDDLGSKVRVANFKAQSTRNFTTLKNIAGEFDDIAKAIAATRKITHQQADLDSLQRLETAAKAYQGAIGEFVGLNETIDTETRDRLKLMDTAQNLVASVADDGVKRTSDTSKESSAALALAIKVMIGGLVVVSILGILLALFISADITRPLQHGVAFARKLADGDLTQHLDIRQRDEIGQLADAMNEMSEHLRQMFKDIAVGVHTLASSSTELSAVSGQMTSSSKQTSEQSSMVAAAAEEMSVNMTSVAAGMEQTSANIHTVATATEEMTATIGDIARNSEKASAITNQAVSQAQDVSSLMGELGRAAREIGKVTETISAISAQTNLLALNATIEAARAGAAGKGFAVVAGEIKELAQQTAAATEDIKRKIDGIQNSTATTVGDIEKISHVIQEVNDIVTTIAAAIEEQSVVTRDIAGNIAQAAHGVRDVNERVTQSSSAAQAIAQDIAHVDQAAGEINASSTQVRTSAEELSGLAERLKEMARRFQV